MSALLAAALLFGISGSAGTSYPKPATKAQVASCVKAVTGRKALTKAQVNDCLATVLQTYDPQPCPKDPSQISNGLVLGPYVAPRGYEFDLGGGYAGIKGKAAHTWAIRVGSRPFRVNKSDTEATIAAAICGETAPTTTTTVVSASALVTWCGLTDGESKSNVLAQMGPPHGTKAETEAHAMGLSGDDAEWDVGNDLLLATFVNDQVTSLQAYKGVVGPGGATDLSCAPFRNGGGS